MPHMQMETDMGRPLIQWRAVFGGAVLGLGALLLFGSLWLALAVQEEVATVADNMDWYLGGTAIFAALLGGFLAGWLSGIRGIAQGIVNGSSVWALVILGTVAIGIPAAFAELSPQEITGLPGEATWPTFWSLLIGLGAAALGGMLGGMIPRAAMRTTATTYERDHEHDDARGRAPEYERGAYERTPYEREYEREPVAYEREPGAYEGEPEAYERESEAERNRREAQRLENESERLRQEAERRRRAS